MCGVPCILYSEGMHRIGVICMHVRTSALITRYGVAQGSNFWTQTNRAPTPLWPELSWMTSPGVLWHALNAEAAVEHKPYCRFRTRGCSCMPRHRRRHGAHVTGRTVIFLTASSTFRNSRSSDHTLPTHNKHPSFFPIALSRFIGFVHFLKSSVY